MEYCLCFLLVWLVFYEEVVMLVSKFFSCFFIYLSSGSFILFLDFFFELVNLVVIDIC